MGTAQRPLPPPPGASSGAAAGAARQRSGRALGALPRRGKFTLFPPTVALALSRLRQTWRLLLVTQLGVLAAVTLMCMIPLFSQVSLSAGLRLALTQSTNRFSPYTGLPISPVASSQQTATEQVDLFAGAPTADDVQQIQQRVDGLVQHYIGRYLAGPAQFSLSLQPLPLVSSGQTGIQDGDTMSLVASDPTQVGAHVNLVDGSLPEPHAAQVQIALTPEAAANMHVGVGSTLTLSIPSAAQNGQTQQNTSPPTILMHVVGLFEPQDVDTFWNGQDFTPHSQGRPGVSAQPSEYEALAAQDTMLSVISPRLQSAIPSPINGPLPPNVKIFYGGAFDLTWTYTIDVTRISASDLGTLTDGYNSMRNDLFNLQGDLDVRNVNAYGALDQIQQYQGRVFSVMVPITLLMLQIIGLVLLFVQLMANVLAERQAEAIAILRSRGAHRRQILGALVVQGLGLSVIAAVAGPLLAIPLVRGVAGQLLPANSQDALDVIGGNPIDVARGILIFALIAAVGAMIALLVSLLRAANANVVALRRESARSTGKSLAQRLHLDLILALLAALTYTLYSVALAALGPSARAGLGALAVVWPIFLLLAGAALFLRIFPLLLRFGSWLASRASGATSMLALSQMSRAPRQSTRMMLLLALTTAFAIFTLLFTASQAQHLVDVTAYQVGADFSGTLPVSGTSTTPQSLAQVTSTYRSIPGVTSATAGYVTNTALSDNRGGTQVQMLVMDSGTFASTALWKPTYSSQPLSTLTALMATVPTGESDTVPAVVDGALAKGLGVGEGGHFSLSLSGYTNGQQMRFVVVAVVHHIPTVFSSPDFPFQGGMLADYTTFAGVYKTDTGSAAPIPNTVWLRGGDDESALASVRSAINSSAQALTNPLDRRELLAAQQGDPLQLNLVGTLLVGATTALALALIGGWIASWLNARSRLTSFAVLRAIGTTPRQILRVLLWEYGIVYLTALALGLLFGWLLSSAALPALVFADALDTATSGPPVFDVPPLQLVAPIGELALVLGGLVVLCALAVGIMTYLLSRSSLSATLRLNQD